MAGEAPKLGDAVRDILTGFEGIVVARIEHLFSGQSYLVQPHALGGDGHPLPPLELPMSRVRVVQRDALYRDLTNLFDQTPRL
jgi:hypothetical protein